MLEFSVQELEETMVEEATISSTFSQLIVHNDDFNTFDWVIQSLMEICDHTFEQAEQLSLIIHFKGKAVVKTSFLDELRPMKDALTDRGISAVIETLVEE